jgi:hypothetical protein
MLRAVIVGRTFSAERDDVMRWSAALLLLFAVLSAFVLAAPERPSPRPSARPSEVPVRLQLQGWAVPAFATLRGRVDQARPGAQYALEVRWANGLVVRHPLALDDEGGFGVALPADIEARPSRIYQPVELALLQRQSAGMRVLDARPFAVTVVPPGSLQAGDGLRALLAIETKLVAELLNRRTRLEQEGRWTPTAAQRLASLDTLGSQLAAIVVAAALPAGTAVDLPMEVTREGVAPPTLAVGPRTRAAFDRIALLLVSQLLATRLPSPPLPGESAPYLQYALERWIVALPNSVAALGESLTGALTGALAIANADPPAPELRRRAAELVVFHALLIGALAETMAMLDAADRGVRVMPLFEPTLLATARDALDVASARACDAYCRFPGEPVLANLGRMTYDPEAIAQELDERLAGILTGLEHTKPSVSPVGTPFGPPPEGSVSVAPAAPTTRAP